MLSEVGRGKVVTLVGIQGGRHMRAKLFGMGLLPGTTFTVVSRNGHGPVMLKVKETRLAIGRGMAQMMVVA